MIQSLDLLIKIPILRLLRIIRTNRLEEYKVKIIV